MKNEETDKEDGGTSLTEGVTACPLVPAAQLSHDAVSVAENELYAAIRILAGNPSTAALVWQNIDDAVLNLEAAVRQSGSVSVPLSETSGSNAQERSAKQTHSQLVPSLPSADIRPLSSYRHQHDFACESWRCATCGHSAEFHHKIPSVLDEPHPLLPEPCTCGLDAALAREQQQRTPVAADGSIAQALQRLERMRQEALANVGHRHYAPGIVEEFQKDADALKLILLCQSEAQQEIENLKEIARKEIGRAETYREHYLLTKARAEAAESLAAERQQEIERLERVELSLAKDVLAQSRRAEQAESSLALLQEQRTTQIQEKKEVS